jgi:hypothetical protein
MTILEILTKHYPKTISIIKERAKPGYLEQVATTSAPNELAGAFDWFSSPEGLEFWNELYERGTDR